MALLKAAAALAIVLLAGTAQAAAIVVTFDFTDGTGRVEGNPALGSFPGDNNDIGTGLWFAAGLHPSGTLSDDTHGTGDRCQCRYYPRGKSPG